MGSKCIGIDVGGTTVKVGIFNTDGEILLKWEVPTRKEENGKYIIGDVAASIKEKLCELNIDLSEVTGAGMGIPGPVLPDGSVEVCVNLGWREMNPASEMSRALGGLPVKSGNDANVAALGEMWQGGGKGFKDVVMITLGTGVGGGVILNEEIIAGKHGLGGEIGHIHVRDDEKEHCNCGGRGCLEQIASATGIAREAKRKLAQDDRPSELRKYGDSLTAKEVFDAAKTGDVVALEVAEKVGYYLGLALAHTSMIIDPEIFVIGGGVSKAGEFLTDLINKYYDELTPISKNKAGIALADLGNDAGIYGAAKLIL